MAEKISGLRHKYSETINLLEKNSLKLLNIKKNELLKVKNDKDMLLKYGEGLEEMVRKQREMMVRWEERQKEAAKGRTSTARQN